MERIDVSSVYVHLIWTYFFCIYLIMACMGVYSIWTDIWADLQKAGGGKENWILFGLILLWMVVAVVVYQVTEAL